MRIGQIFRDKSLNPIERTEYLSTLVLDHIITIDTLLKYAATAKDADKATCLDALEVITKSHPGAIDEHHFMFVVRGLTSASAHVKWESARVIANTIHLFPSKIKLVVPLLLDNTVPTQGTVVRWSTAFALTEILKLGTAINKELIPAIETVAANEEKGNISKIYTDYLSGLKHKTPVTC